jgi:hypothetical protein
MVLACPESGFLGQCRPAADHKPTGNTVLMVQVVPMCLVGILRSH